MIHVSKCTKKSHIYFVNRWDSTQILRSRSKNIFSSLGKQIVQLLSAQFET